jgi:putative oxidoreductase
MKLFLKKTMIVEIIASLFILLFVYTGINKIIAIDSLKHVLKDYPLIGSFPILFAWGLPIVELIVSILLFIPSSRKIGLSSSLFLMIGFTAYLAYMLTFTTHKPCTCGGMLQELSWGQHLIFNIFFIIIGILGIRLHKHLPSLPSNNNSFKAAFT